MMPKITITLDAETRRSFVNGAAKLGHQVYMHDIR